jgi:hypothetical protein
MGHHIIQWPLLLGDLRDCPGQSRAQTFPEHRPTGFADGHQLLKRPLTRTALPQSRRIRSFPSIFTEWIGTLQNSSNYAKAIHRAFFAIRCC